MAVRLLIDECLSPSLEGVAHDMGYEAIHLNHRGWSGLKDPLLFRRVFEESLTLVTNNQSDFERLAGGLEVHPGLIVLTDNVRRDRQQEMLRAALSHLSGAGLIDLVNRVIEVD